MNIPKPKFKLNSVVAFKYRFIKNKFDPIHEQKVVEEYHQGKIVASKFFEKNEDGDDVMSWVYRIKFYTTRETFTNVLEEDILV